MAKYKPSSYFFHGKQAKMGVLLLNLGSPSHPDAASVRRYLRTFLSDPRVVEIPRLIWLPLLNGVILPKRSGESAEKYRSIWMDKGSPLIVHSQAQTQAIQRKLEQMFSTNVHVELAMRYGQPSIASAYERLCKANVRRLLILPLYPQYSATTTASCFDAIFDELKQWRWQPEIRTVNHYHDHPAYIRALADSVREAWKAKGQSKQLLMLFHGIPKRNFSLGDPYFCECQKTARLLAESLELTKDDWQVCFQSRFGKSEWLQPYADQVLRDLPNQGIDTIDVICPGFSADCLETLEEVQQEYNELFLRSGGKHFHYIPALNDRPDHINALCELIAEHTQGWPEQLPTSIKQEQLDNEMQVKRAQSMGAEQ